MTQYITVHSLQFGVNDEDWRTDPNREIADIVRDLLEDLSPDELRGLHARDIVARADDSDDWPFAKIEAEARRIATDGWRNAPQSGHNVFVSAH